MCHVRLRTTTILMTCCVLFGLTAIRAEAQDAAPTGADCEKQAYEVTPVTPGKPVNVTIRYHLTVKCTTKRLTERVDDSMAVLVTLKNFNFVNYAIKYTVQDTVIESYVTLEKLWSQIFGLGALVKSVGDSVAARVAAPEPTCKETPAPGDFIPCVTEWMWALVNEDLTVESDVTTNAGKIALDDIAVKAVGETIKKHEESRKSISDKRLRVLKSTPTSPQDVQWFQEVQAQHDKVMTRSAAYSSLATLTVNGQTKVLPKNKPGHIITLTLAPRRAENTDTDAAAPLVVEYVVQSKFPLVFHVGYGYSRLKDVEFEKVRALNDQDLFSVVKANNDTAGMVAYLSYGLWEWKAGGTEQGFLLTLATDFKDPGDRFLVGGSLRVWKKLFVTAGAMSGSVKEGVNPIVEAIGSQVGARELFGSVSTRRDWKPHVGVSFSVF